jgi:hypothetical protein
VVITGVNLGGAIGVRFNGVSTSAFTNNSATQITASVPAGASTGPISVTTSNGVAQSSSAFVIGSAVPANDAFAARVSLTGSAKTVSGSNHNATKEAGEPDHASDEGGHSVWWSWTAPSSGTYRITTRESTFDTLLAVYTGSSLANLSLVAQNDDGPNMGTASSVTITANAGTAYQIAVDGYGGEAGAITLSLFPGTASQEIYYTGFEFSEGYSTNFALAGQGGWSSSGDGDNGVLYDYFYDESQQGYQGFWSPVGGGSQFLWPTLNHTPNTNTLPVIIFSTFMEIDDSTNFRYDRFGWDVYNQAAKRLFLLGFDNATLEIYYQLNDGNPRQNTGVTFQNGRIYYLEVVMDFARNRWEATLDGDMVASGKAISADGAVARNLGDIDAVWFRDDGGYGDNFMIFDDYLVTAEPDQSPRIAIPPQSQSVAAGGSVKFQVVADSPLEMSYQWRFNGTAISGATLATLGLDNVGPGQAGNYTVTVSNSVGVVTSTAAVLTVTQLANLTPYQPGGWSDKIVVATVPGTNDAATITSAQDVYVSWAVQSVANGAAISSRFYTQLYLDGVLKNTWFSDGLNPGGSSSVTGYALGKLTAGTHTVRIDTDTTSVVPESEETDNSYTRTFTVSPASSPAPQLSAPVRESNGVFRFTLTGTPSRSYEILISTNLVNWSIQATVLNTNANGIMSYTDNTAPGATRRFYRSRLVP